LGQRSLDVDIPRGTRDGTVLRLAGQGLPGIGGGPPGDVYLHVPLVPHPRYRVVGDDLEMDLPLWPWAAVLGGAVKIATPRGRGGPRRGLPVGRRAGGGGRHHAGAPGATDRPRPGRARAAGSGPVHGADGGAAAAAVAAAP